MTKNFVHFVVSFCFSNFFLILKPLWDNMYKTILLRENSLTEYSPSYRFRHMIFYLGSSNVPELSFPVLRFFSLILLFIFLKKSFERCSRRVGLVLTVLFMLLFTFLNNASVLWTSCPYMYVCARICFRAWVHARAACVCVCVCFVVVVVNHI